jgi:hypothetical protein
LEECWDKARFDEWRHALEPLARAQLVVRMIEDDCGDCHEAERLFLVADAWPML